MSPFGMRPTIMSIRSPTYGLVSLTLFRFEVPTEKTIASRSRAGHADNEGTTKLAISAVRSGTSLQIACFVLDCTIIVLTVLELVREIPMTSIFCVSSAGRDFHLSPAFLITSVILCSARRLSLISSRFSVRSWP